MLVRWGNDGKPEIQMDMKREHAKAVHDSHEIFNLEVPHYNRMILEWATHMLQQPILKVSTYPGPTGAIQEPSLFSKQLKKASQISCYIKITASDFRGEGLTRTNNLGYSNAERMKFASHKTCDTYRIYYVAKESVNGCLCPVFQGDQLRTDEKTPTAETPKAKANYNLRRKFYRQSPDP
ncbi:hypothetical protein EAF04_008761 [Stromatinia cepivora]|nr:hypothetical protein EAF04_008761 [Stromatinia cepivora]